VRWNLRGKVPGCRATCRVAVLQLQLPYLSQRKSVPNRVTPASARAPPRLEASGIVWSVSSVQPAGIGYHRKMARKSGTFTSSRSFVHALTSPCEKSCAHRALLDRGRRFACLFSLVCRSAFKKFCKRRVAQRPKRWAFFEHKPSTQWPRCDKGQHRTCICLPQKQRSPPRMGNKHEKGARTTASGAEKVACARGAAERAPEPHSPATSHASDCALLD
jgi:hypothetical protein